MDRGTNTSQSGVALRLPPHSIWLWPTFLIAPFAKMRACIYLQFGYFHRLPSRERPLGNTLIRKLERIWQQQTIFAVEWRLIITGISPWFWIVSIGRQATCARSFRPRSEAFAPANPRTSASVPLKNLMWCQWSRGGWISA